MSNLEARPDERVCASGGAPAGGLEILEPRDVPLGGPRAMSVRRTLPQRDRSMVGAWCFLDHYGPADVTASAGMQVPPHPHTGLQTVSWLFEGEVQHHDSIGSAALVRPGELNLMTAGAGISHSEQSPPVRSPLLHGVQLWIALPESARHGAPAFEHHGDLPVLELPGARVRLLVGELAGVRSPATTFTPSVGAQVDLPRGSRAVLPVDSTFEHAVLVDRGTLRIDGTAVAPSSLAYLPPGRAEIGLEAGADDDARLILIGGVPFGAEIVMWWNFVGRSHEEIVAARAQWQAGLVGGSDRFGQVDGFDGPPLPAPELPNGRLRPRR
ncbi:pirin family protein [Pengzhenrongella sicca]|uniref:Pirin family protein n=1 Tax=Pengzhenrongella sicca TaxID=2819238 RepID=A0A8A4ZG15_9MICO|nr:pirin family protein [Pengzhenrongella sicca]QTE29427.1 pirin family protein [Pengzhenrongella sicca]